MSDTLKPVVKNLTPPILYQLFKLQVPITIIFIDAEGNENVDYRIKIEKRVYDKKENKPQVRLGKSNTLFNDSYDRLLTSIDMKINEGYKYGVFATVKDLTQKKNLIDLVGKINKELIEMCTFIDYNFEENYFELRNQPLSNGTSDVIYYFEKDNSVLQFNSDGPEVFRAEEITNVTDILCD